MGTGVYLSGLAYEVGERRELADLAVTDVDARARLLANGLVAYRHSDLSAPELAVRAFRKTMAAWSGNPQDIDAIIYCSERFSDPGNAALPFKELCDDNGIRDRPVIGLTLGDCANLAPALRVARGLMHAERLRNVAIVTASTARSAEDRLSFFDLAVLSDAGASCIASLDADGAEVRVGGIGHASTPYLRELERDSERPKLAASVAAGVRRAMTLARADAGLGDDPFAYMISTSTHASIMALIGQYCGIPPGETFLGTVESFGHCYSADLIINLVESAAWRAQRDQGQARPFLLLAMSISTWGAMICESISGPDPSAASGALRGDAAPSDEKVDA